MILLNGEQVATEYVSQNELRALSVTLADEDIIAVAQVSATDTLLELSQTAELTFSAAVS